jgi:chromosome segregation ATPase
MDTLNTPINELMTQGPTLGETAGFVPATQQPAPVVDDLAVQRQTLVQERAKLDRKEAELRDEAWRRLDAEHDDLVTQCRRAKDEISRLEEQHERAQRRAITAQGESMNESRHLADLQAEKPRASNYPSKAEIAAWNTELRRREVAANKASEAEAQAWSEVHALRRQRDEAREKFAKLADQEAELRGRLAPADAPAKAVTMIVGSSYGSVSRVR